MHLDLLSVERMPGDEVAGVYSFAVRWVLVGTSCCGVKSARLRRQFLLGLTQVVSATVGFFLFVVAVSPPLVAYMLCAFASTEVICASGVLWMIS